MTERYRPTFDAGHRGPLEFRKIRNGHKQKHIFLFVIPKNTGGRRIAGISEAKKNFALDFFSLSLSLSLSCAVSERMSFSGHSTCSPFSFSCCLFDPG